MTAVAMAGTNSFGLDAELFTRGTGADKDRGESMVQKHLEKMQQDKENIAMVKLGAIMPQMGSAVRMLALQESAFDVDKAVSMLRAFQSQNEDVSRLHKKRNKLQLMHAEAVKKAEMQVTAEASPSSSESSESDSSDSSDDNKEDRSDKKKKKKKKHSSSSKKERKNDKDKKRRKKKSKSDDDRNRKKRKSSGGGTQANAQTGATNTANFGRFGLLKEGDMHTKHAEFTLWAVEVKKMNPEHVGRLEEKELFRDFMEDFNTGTLPHRKYYNLDIYQKEKAAKHAAKHGKQEEAQPKKQMALQDEEDLRREREVERLRQADERRRRDLMELQLTSKAKDMREQELLRLQMQAAYKTGDRAKAAVLQKQLMTDDEKMAKGIMKWKPKI